MKNKGTKRKAEQKQHESTKVVRRKTKHSKPQLEPEFFRDQRELEAFDEGGVLHGEKVYLFVSTEAPIERPDTLIPTVIA
ncbi:hypothetical protein Tco_1496083, partial [Tanacetum coccineum]